MLFKLNKRIDLQRFIDAQEPVYDDALSELKAGRKRLHWMWFIFPQLSGLGQSKTAKFYAINGIEEAKAYLDHPVLGGRLLECMETLLIHKDKAAYEILGYIDKKKLRSCATLFASATENNDAFLKVLEMFFDGNKCQLTLEKVH